MLFSYASALDFCTVRLYNIFVATIEYVQNANFPQALKELVAVLKRRTFDPDEYYVILTPDRYTQTVESAVLCGGGAIDLEVLTLSRLAYRISPDDVTLSREGGVMITAQAIAAVKDRLTYYARAAKFADFARQAYDALQQIASCDVLPSDVAASGVTAAKLFDLALIKREYDRIKACVKDAPDRLAALAENAGNSPFISRCRFFAVGFADITRLNKRVFGAIAAAAKSFVMFTAAAPRGKRKSLDVFSAPDKITEYKHIATDIKRRIAHGAKYGDIHIICTAPHSLERILREYDIPAYTDEITPLSSTPPLRALADVYKLHTALRSRAALDVGALVSLCKNTYCGVDPEDAEMLQCYAFSRALGFVPKSYVFDEPAASRAAARAIELVQAFGSAHDFASAVNALVSAGDFQSISRELNRKSGGTDEVAAMLALVDLLVNYGSGEFEKDAAALFSAARAADVKSVPRERDRVTVTMPQSLRLTSCKRLYAVDFNEGVLPLAIADAGLLCDDELRELQNAVEPTAAEQNRRNREELLAVINNAEYVCAAYSTAGGARPSAFIAELAEKTNYDDFAKRCAELYNTDDVSAIADNAPVPSAARELAARGFTKYAPSVAAAAGKTSRAAKPFCEYAVIEKKPTISVSELACWFICPYKRFLTSAIGLNERRRALDAPSFGIIVHEFMQKFVNAVPYDCSRQAVERIIAQALESRGIAAPPPADYNRMVDDAIAYAQANVQIINAGKYRPAYTEYRFGGKTFGKSSPTEFVGFIDRIDVCGKRARIMDYKTGDNKFTVSECLNGRDMQLPLYAYAVDCDVTGMFYVKLGKRYSSGEKPRALHGCMIKDVQIATEYDQSLTPDGEASSIVPVKLKTDKDGNVAFGGRASAALTERQTFENLIERCVRNADVAADEIASGYISRSPAKGGCEYCPYRPICGNTAIERGTQADDLQDDAED